MKPPRARRPALAVALALLGMALGCGQNDPGGGSVAASTTAGGSGGGGGSGYDAGSRCLEIGTGGGVVFPTCPERFTSAFIGTIDGKPYSTSHSGSITSMEVPFYPPYSLSTALGGSGYLTLDWSDPYVQGRWTDIDSGTIVLREDGILRAVLPGSQLLWSCDDYFFLYVLHLTGGDLTGCSR